LPAWAQPSLALSPSVITTCGVPGLGRARIFWDVPGVTSVQLRAGGPDGTIMGIEPSRGSTTTVDWVQDGTVFALVTDDGQELASLTASVVCQPKSAQAAAAAQAGSYFPLDVGDEWVYRVDSRDTTALDQTRRVERAANPNSSARPSGFEGHGAVEHDRHGDHRPRTDGSSGGAFRHVAHDSGRLSSARANHRRSQRSNRFGVSCAQDSLELAVAQRDATEGTRLDKVQNRETLVPVRSSRRMNFERDRAGRKSGLQ